MQDFGIDAFVALLRLLQAIVVPDLGLAAVLAGAAAVAAVALALAIVVAVVTRAGLSSPPARPAVDGIRAPRTARPDWARPGAPGRRRPRAPGSILAT